MQVCPGSAGDASAGRGAGLLRLSRETRRERVCVAAAARCLSLRWGRDAWVSRLLVGYTGVGDSYLLLGRIGGEDCRLWVVGARLTA